MTYTSDGSRHRRSLWLIKPRQLLGELMRITKSAFAADIVVLLGIFLLVEWLSTTLTNTRNFAALVIGWGAYLAVRLAFAARHARKSN
jgi:hypothetical protein